jgi:hypothetical protein
MTATEDRKSYLVECYWPGVSVEKLVDTLRRVHEAQSQLRGCGADVEFLGSILVPVDETVFCLFDGSEADVRAVSEQAGVLFERVLESLRFDGEEPEGGRP